MLTTADAVIKEEILNPNLLIFLLVHLAYARQKISHVALVIANKDMLKKLNTLFLEARA